jgi:diaminohydroxyphosphoribosylaminopyrimidine deaminase/5-amino-6-(5-phosphoribosylamino)uracil reductase
LVDEVVAYLAPMLLGAGPAALGPAGVNTVAGAHRLYVREVVPISTDVRITAVRRGPAATGSGQSKGPG